MIRKLNTAEVRGKKANVRIRGKAKTMSDIMSHFKYKNILDETELASRIPYSATPSVISYSEISQSASPVCSTDQQQFVLWEPCATVVSSPMTQPSPYPIPNSQLLSTKEQDDQNYSREAQFPGLQEILNTIKPQYSVLRTSHMERGLQALKTLILYAGGQVWGHKKRRHLLIQFTDSLNVTNQHLRTGRYLKAKTTYDMVLHDIQDLGKVSDGIFVTAICHMLWFTVGRPYRSLQYALLLFLARLNIQQPISIIATIAESLVSAREYAKDTAIVYQQYICDLFAVVLGRDSPSVLLLELGLCRIFCTIKEYSTALLKLNDLEMSYFDGRDSFDQLTRSLLDYLFGSLFFNLKSFGKAKAYLGEALNNNSLAQELQHIIVDCTIKLSVCDYQPEIHVQRYQEDLKFRQSFLETCTAIRWGDYNLERFPYYLNEELRSSWPYSDSYV